MNPVMDFPAPFTQDFLDNLLYLPEVLFFDRIESLDLVEKKVVCRMPTDRPLPLTDSQRVHPTLHPRHVAGAIMIHCTAMLGFVHAFHIHGLRHDQGWTGYGAQILKASFRKLVPPGDPLICSCVETKVRKMGNKIFSTYHFDFRLNGELAYESDQTAMWLKVDASS